MQLLAVTVVLLVVSVLSFANGTPEGPTCPNPLFECGEGPVGPPMPVFDIDPESFVSEPDHMFYAVLTGDEMIVQLGKSSNKDELVEIPQRSGHKIFEDEIYAFTISVPMSGDGRYLLVRGKGLLR